MLWLWLYEVKQKKQPHLEVNFEYTANVCRNVFLYVSVCDPICMYVCMNVCVCGGGEQIAKCILDDCDNFTSSVELSARLLKFQPYPFSCCLWRKETEWFKKKKKKSCCR